MRRLLLASTALFTAACMPPPPNTGAPAPPTTAVAATAPALGPREREVIDVVERLFDAMRAGDSAAARALFEPGARLQTVATTQAGVLRLSEDSVGMFLRAIGTPHRQVYDERIANERVLIDDSFAVAWVDYTFYLDDQKSHCGVDAFQLIRRPAGWRIFGLTDTRRRLNCPDLPRR